MNNRLINYFLLFNLVNELNKLEIKVPFTPKKVLTAL